MLVAPGPPAHLLPVQEARINHVQESEALCGPSEPVGEERDLCVPGPGGDVPVRAYNVPGAGDALRPMVVYLHGGGWMLGSVETYTTPVRRLAAQSGAVVLSVDYRLAPEHRFPAALDDTLAAVRWAAAEGASVGGDPARIAVAGDSAGGNLAAVAARRLRDEVPLRLQALVYPVTDAGLNTPSYREFGEEHGLTAATMGRFWELYLDGADGTDPDVSPLRAEDLSGVAPAWVLTADHDVLRDEGEAYAAALERAGVDCALVRWPGAIHGFIRWIAAAGESRRALDALAEALREALAPSAAAGGGERAWTDTPAGAS
jgi:acetyl esterase